jgi:hypothetical protein
VDNTKSSLASMIYKKCSFHYFQGKNHKLHVYASIPIKKGEKDLLNNNI